MMIKFFTLGFMQFLQFLQLETWLLKSLYGLRQKSKPLPFYLPAFMERQMKFTRRLSLKEMLLSGISLQIAQEV